jgi:hypothetical protein
MLGLLAPILGAALMLLVLSDVYLTVLYARAGSGIISPRLAYGTWQLFRWTARPFPRTRQKILSFCGPTILVLLVTVWTLLLAVGIGLVIWPHLGTSVRASGEQTPTDLLTAIYAGGNSMMLVGAASFSPQTAAFKLLFLFTSLVGMSMITLTLTYFLQIYNAIQRRNTAALDVHVATDETGDAAELLASLGPRGDFSDASSHLVELASHMTTAKESHHFYPVLIYFRFPEPFYAVTRVAVVALDTVTLIKSALDDERYAKFKESLAVQQLWSATMRLLTAVSMTFLPGGMPDGHEEPDPETRERWRRRYFAAIRRLRQAGIATIADERQGLEIYLSLRARWERYIEAFARFLAQEMDDLDPSGAHPEWSDDRDEFDVRLHGVA